MTREREDLSLVPSQDGSNTKHYGVATATLFIIGIMGGGAVPIIPQAFVNSGWTGVVLTIASSVIVACNGYLIGNCWTTLQVEYPEYTRQRLTAPYPAIAFKVTGKFGEQLARICVNVTQFGVSTVFTIQIAENISNLTRAFGGGEISTCFVILVLWGVFTPISWLGTLKEFWQGGIVAGIITILGAVLIVAGLEQDAHLHEHAEATAVTVYSFFNAFGTVLFVFGGVSIFPNVQVDMANPNDFWKAAVIGVASIAILYLMNGIVGLVTFGADMTPNVTSALSATPLFYIITIIVTSQMFMSVVISISPVTRDIEGLLQIPDRFSWKRVLVRTCYTAGINFTAQTVPHFSIIVGIVGSSTMACMTVIFPPLLYLLISRRLDVDSNVEQDRSYSGQLRSNCTIGNIGVRRISTFSKILLLGITIVGIVGAASSTFFAFDSLVNGWTGFTLPCFVNWTQR